MVEWFGIALFVYLNSQLAVWVQVQVTSTCWVCHAACVERWGAAIAPVMTSGNGNTNSSQHNGESKPAQALVKSDILTHLIEGFVIQEGAEPFPVSTGALLLSVCKASDWRSDTFFSFPIPILIPELAYRMVPGTNPLLVYEKNKTFLLFYSC